MSASAQCDHRDSRAEAGRHRQDADRVGPAVARHLLGGDDTDQEGEGDAHRARQGLGDDEDAERRGDRAEHGQQGTEPGDPHDHPASSDPVGDHGRREGDDDADADEGAGDADAGVVDAEIVRGERRPSG